ncbi:MAG: transposase [Treponema sp.]|jgi:putative transposase|nr:transposase [Treponema sp.]
MRPLRKLQDGAVYHVASKINRGAMELRPPQFKIMFLSFIKRAKRKYPFQLLNFCVMDNHIHLIIKPGESQSLSKIMQWIKGNFAKRWNKAHHTEGHLWGDRFFSKIIENADQFLKAFRYVDENPVAAKMVARAEEWEHGGLYHDMLGRRDVVDIPREAMKATLRLFFDTA